LLIYNYNLELHYGKPYLVTKCCLKLQPTVQGFARERIFSTTFDTKLNVQIYEKVSNEALNPLSCKTLVVGSAFFNRFGFGRFVVRLVGSSFAFFVWLCAVGKMQMCYQKRWLICLVNSY
jgi:hypothetical protein